jgi:hypothetical protein
MSHRYDPNATWMAAATQCWSMARATSSLLTGFTAVSALLFRVTGYISVYEVHFKDFRCAHGRDPSAVKVAQALEFLPDRCHFFTFTNEGLI